MIARDQAYFNLAFFRGDRPGDLGQIKVPEILRLPNDDGFLFNHIWGKTLRDGDGNVFGVRRNAQVEICPIQGIERHMEVTRGIRVDLTCGYLFRPITPDLGIKDAPFTSSAAESRLKGYLKEMNADNGETLHGFRSGCVITLALTGADLAEIMDHVGWTRRHTALYYMQLAKVLNPAGASIHTAYIKATHIRSVHVNKLSLWLNCRTVRGSCRYGTIGACGEARGFNARFVFPTHPPSSLTL